MPFRTWMYVFAIVGLTLSSSVHAQQQNDEAEQSTTDEQTATDQTPFALPVIIIESDEASEARQSEESERTQREKDDLVAQQGMNTATHAMNEATQSMKRASWVSTFLVGFGSLLLIWTLLLTRSANNAAHTAVRVTREIGEAQTRAYIGMDNLTASVEPGNTGFQLYAKFFNQGQTPAREVYWQAQFYTAQEFSEEVWGNLAEPIYRGSIPVADESYIDATISTSSGDSRKDIDDVFSGDQHVFFAYHLRYQSIFGVKEFESFGVSKLIRRGDDGWAFAAVPTERKDT